MSPGGVPTIRGRGVFHGPGHHAIDGTPSPG